MIINHVMQQTFVSAVNDGFLVAGAISIACLAPIFFLRRRKLSRDAKGKMITTE